MIAQGYNMGPLFLGYNMVRHWGQGRGQEPCPGIYIYIIFIYIYIYIYIYKGREEDRSRVMLSRALCFIGPYTLNFRFPSLPLRVGSFSSSFLRTAVSLSLSL
jgi:hypothetical protein